MSCLRICSLLEAAKRAKSYSRSVTEDTNKETDTEDSLTGLFEQLWPLTPLCTEIRRCVLSEDEIADDASSSLRSIRKAMRGMNDKIRAQMNAMINNTTTRSYLQDTVITMRDGRYCLPVRAEAKSQVPGMVHDQSSSGSTLFIEPMAVVNLNNEYKELLLREQEEIEVILANLSNLAAGSAMELETDYRIINGSRLYFCKGFPRQKLQRRRAILQQRRAHPYQKRTPPAAGRKKSRADRHPARETILRS